MMEYNELEGCLDIKSEDEIKKEEDGCDSMMPSDEIELKPFVEISCNHETNHTIIESGLYQDVKSALNRETCVMGYHELEECLDIKSEGEVKKEEDECDGDIPHDDTEIKPFVNNSYDQTNQTTIECVPCENASVTEMGYLKSEMETRSRTRSVAELATLEARTSEIVGDDASSGEEEDGILAQSDSDSEENVSEDESESAEPTPSKRGRPSFLRSKSGFTWSLSAPTQPGRESGASSGATEHTPAPKDAALHVKSALEAWSLLFTDDMLEIIVIHTNKEIDKYVTRTNTTDPQYTKRTDRTEIRAYIGLSYYAGLFKVNNTRTDDLWSVHAPPLFRAAMTQRRYKFLAMTIRFDDKSTRQERLQTDRFAHVRRLWDMFINNCREYYTPGDVVTLGEQLLSFRGRCGFKIYIPAKPDRYGIKIVSLNDARTHYMIDAIPHVGTVQKLAEESVPSYYVRMLSQSIYNSKRTIVMDNRFTNVEDIKKTRREYDLTVVGAVRKNKPEIPASFKRPPVDGKNYQFCYSNGMTLLSYSPKKNKIVLVISSLHETGVVEEGQKPNMMLFYDEHKGATDTFDKKCRDYTVVRKTSRWPVRIFYGMLDQANVNSHILFCLCKANNLKTRHEFILELSMALVKPYMSIRLTKPVLRLNVRNLIESFMSYDEIPAEQDVRDELPVNLLDKKKRCQLCASSIDRKTKYFCLRCRKPMCFEHTSKHCS